MSRFTIKPRIKYLALCRVSSLCKYGVFQFDLKCFTITFKYIVYVVECVEFEEM